MSKLFHWIKRMEKQLSSDLHSIEELAHNLEEELPSGNQTIQCFYDNLAILPQGQSRERLAAWFSKAHPRYNMSSWCFFGNITDDNGNTAAISSIVQRNDLPGQTPYVSEWSFCDDTTKGYVLAPFLTEAGNVEFAEPFAITVDANPLYSGLMNLALTAGRMGEAGASYRMTGRVMTEPDLEDEWTYELVLTDTFGCIQIGYGPSSFQPQWLMAEQQKQIMENYQGNVESYLKESCDHLLGQGSYYYSFPLLQVNRCLIRKNGAVHFNGSKGNLWIDYVVQSFNQESLDIVKTASWQFFAVQFPEIPGYYNYQAAMMIFIVEVELPGGGKSVLPMARFYDNDPYHSKQAENGATIASHEWAIDQITFTPTKTWSDGSKDFPVAFTLEMKSDTGSISLTGKAIRDNQVVKLVEKYEGVFDIEADIQVSNIQAEKVRGFAWAEVR